MVGAYENLALVYTQLGRHDEAVPMLRKIRAAKLRQLRGSETPASVAALLNLSVSLAQAGRHTEAIQLLSKERPAACQALGEDHVHCLCMTHVLGRAHFQHGMDSDDATELLAACTILRDGILRCRKVLGPDHPQTHDSEHDFVIAMEALEKTGCEAAILESLCSGVLRGGWHSKESEPRSRKQYEPRARK